MLGSSKNLRKVHMFIHPMFFEFYARYRVGEEVKDLRGRRVKRGSLDGSR